MPISATQQPRNATNPRGLTTGTNHCRTSIIIPAARGRDEPPMQARPRGFRFSDAFLKKLKVPEGQREVIQFEAGTGLGVRVSANGQISFIVQLRLKDGSR